MLHSCPFTVYFYSLCAYIYIC
uniref:Uncharacterized protein n=1 Tax=Anguilla anguilla TaxID=7936 RepID=A0A0E9XPC8_ANGAN